MGPKKRTGQPTAFDAPPVLTGKRKRATVSYVEVEGEIDAMGNDEEPKLADEIITNDSDEDEAFTTGRKVCRLTLGCDDACTADKFHRRSREHHPRKSSRRHQRRRSPSGSASSICHQNFAT